MWQARGGGGGGDARRLEAVEGRLNKLEEVVARHDTVLGQLAGLEEACRAQLLASQKLEL